ncbi:MAG TPA: hypothetical protein DHV52_02235 [Parachlamydiales bacterium]|nr:hypothetical protein [Parachlamydiales bacterium]
MSAVESEESFYVTKLRSKRGFVIASFLYSILIFFSMSIAELKASENGCSCYNPCSDCVLCIYSACIREDDFLLKAFDWDKPAQIAEKFPCLRKKVPLWCLPSHAMLHLKKAVYDLFSAEAVCDYLYLHSNWNDPKYFRNGSRRYGSEGARVTYQDVKKRFTKNDFGKKQEIKFYREFIEKIGILRESFLRYIDVEIDALNHQIEKWEDFLSWNRCGIQCECRAYGGKKAISENLKSDQVILKNEKDNYIKAQIILDKIESEITKTFEEIHRICASKHFNIETTYDQGLMAYQLGNYNNCINAIETLLKTASKEDFEELENEIELTLGSAYLETGLYHESVKTLSDLIKRDPNNKKAYYERALAHFELGDFDQASVDFAFSDFSGQKGGVTDKVQFALGFATGISQGIAQEAIEFIPGIFSSLQGLSHCLWAIGSDPKKMLCGFVDGIYSIFDFIRAHPLQDSTLEAAMIVAPELREIIYAWPSLEDKIKGEKVGQLIGKYGIDILLVPGSIKTVQSLRQIKKANGILTLDSLSSINAQTNAIRASSEAWTLQRYDTLRKIILEKKGVDIKALENDISYWLGENTKLIYNKSGDIVLLSKDGQRKLRFDFIKPAPHKNPHLHFEQLINGEWEEISRVYPNDVLHK